MFLNLNDKNQSMKIVYQLTDELKINPQLIIKAQALTLNKSRPLMGLKGTHGLFASDEWWTNIRNKVMPTLHLNGLIKRVYAAGQDYSNINNSIDLLLDDGSIYAAGITVNNDKDRALFKKGARVEILYALDELKKQPAPNGGINYSKVTIEVAVSQ